jgi:hypothetical protein
MLRFLTLPLFGRLILKPNRKTAEAEMGWMFADQTLVPRGFVDQWIERIQDPEQRKAFFRLLRSGIGITGIRQNFLYGSRIPELQPRTLIVWGAEDHVVTIPVNLDE